MSNERSMRISAEDLKEIAGMTVNQQLELAVDLERRALAIRQHALTLQKRKKKAGNGHHRES